MSRSRAPRHVLEFALTTVSSVVSAAMRIHASLARLSGKSSQASRSYCDLPGETHHNLVCTYYDFEPFRCTAREKCSSSLLN